MIPEEKRGNLLELVDRRRLRGVSEQENDKGGWEWKRKKKEKKAGRGKGERIRRQGSLWGVITPMIG